MERKTRPLGKPFIGTLLLYVVCVWIPHGYAFESWVGEVSTKVNLRKSPGLDQEIVTVLDEAIIVEVMDKSGEWYQVVTLWEESEYKGWVYGKHIRKTSQKEKAPEPPSEMGQEEKTGESAHPLKARK